ncbi:MAG: DNA methylase [Spirochaetes bacterium GWC1_27_15]|nr:MAG: DNA methylase [Spirochaetes bacterium GWB1_27_13]OHD27053.1 MAG: DNA methylase [Spirochaetes bacterium GWC1_27_15]
MDTKEKLARIDFNQTLKEKLLPHCRLNLGEVWEDPIRGHRVGVLDATNKDDVLKLVGDKKASLIVNDPPYNIILSNANTKNLGKINIAKYIDFSKKWVSNAVDIMDMDASFYVWLGADQNEGFQPLPDFMIMMRDFYLLKSKSFITMRNQRGYGTQKNWMAIRQELLYYIKGNPIFNIEAEYTDIPKILKGGYYKEVNGKIMDTTQRSKSDYIRAGNVWVDIQQVFYRMQENIAGCYAQKPIKSIERIIKASSNENNIVVDLFSHSGTTLLASEKSNRICFTMDFDPIFAELTIRRLENFRNTGKTGWQWNNPFHEFDNRD